LHGDDDGGGVTVFCQFSDALKINALSFIHSFIHSFIMIYQLSYHLYADDTQPLGSPSTSIIQSIVDRLQNYVAAIHQWCASRRLQLNPRHI